MHALTCLALLFCVACATATPIATNGVVLGGDEPDGTGIVDWHTDVVTAPVVMGPQGGQHIWVSLRTSRDFYPSKMRILVDMFDLDTAQAVKPGQMPFTRTASDTGLELQVIGVTAYVKEPCKIKGHHVRVHVSIEDLVGLTGSDEAVIIPTWSGFCGS